jgi:thiol-disulfide isomerase/thioredoxin
MKSCFVVSMLLVLALPCESAEKRALLPKLKGAKSVLHQRPPPLQVEKWLTAKPDTKGKFVLIDFWGTWCGACRTLIPELNAYQKKFGDKLVVIGLTDEDEATVRKMTVPKMEYASAIDTMGCTKRDLQVWSFPHVIIVDPKGIVRWEGFPRKRGPDYVLNEVVIENLIRTYGAK